MSSKAKYHVSQIVFKQKNVCQSGKKIGQTNRQTISQTKTKTASRNSVKFKERQVFYRSFFCPLQFFLFYRPFSATTLIGQNEPTYRPK